MLRQKEPKDVHFNVELILTFVPLSLLLFSLFLFFLSSLHTLRHHTLRRTHFAAQTSRTSPHLTHTAPHMQGTVKLPHASLSGSRTNEYTKTISTNVDPPTQPLGGPEYVGRSSSVAQNYRTAELPALSSAKEREEPAMKLFLGGSRSVPSAATTTTNNKRRQRSSNNNNNNNKKSSTSSNSSNTNLNATTNNNTNTTTSSAHFHPTSSRPRIVSKEEKLRDLMERQLVSFHDPFHGKKSPSCLVFIFMFNVNKVQCVPCFFFP